MFINEDELRRLANKKASRPVMGRGTPEPNEGVDGDFRLNNTPSGVKLYAKFAGQWFPFSPDSSSESIGNTYCLHGGFFASSAIIRYFYVGQSGSVQTSSAGDSHADNILFIAPWSGKVKSIVVRGAFGSTPINAAADIRIWSSADGDNVTGGNLIGNERITFNVPYQTLIANYKGSRFKAGEALKFGIESYASTSMYCAWSALIEINS